MCVIERVHDSNASFNDFPCHSLAQSWISSCIVFGDGDGVMLGVTDGDGVGVTITDGVVDALVEAEGYEDGALDQGGFRVLDFGAEPADVIRMADTEGETPTKTEAIGVGLTAELTDADGVADVVPLRAIDRVTLEITHSEEDGVLEGVTSTEEERDIVGLTDSNGVVDAVAGDVIDGLTLGVSEGDGDAVMEGVALMET